ncbi:TPA: HBL/NHE enterotoxin family protein [Pseudomonas putida]|uniref:HBL/NHE enterotoxin family protein n=1 Tax=Pseudomonas TaxID=286 RepID=UPI000481B0C7|nr:MULTISPECIES: HBL/NHE enterotoxin family protein [Pseudomonas]MDD2153400.1 HBL/NHE enterotoxin family protein [Pseudomonas putida]RAS23033.1 hemolytic enterotoxin HBL [Pseudomonas sp. URMO17WK12:I7]SMF56164.1 Phage-related protein, tail component [Pseudomonas sp. URMO17WK12:I5]HDS1681202.1 HBL/NHE enterotoxin family protein [Pseudomonas putida]
MDALKKQFFPFTLNPLSNVVSIAALGSVSAAPRASNDLPIDQQLADAFNANNDVMAYVLGITNTQLPTISPAPTWYSTFQTAFSNAQIHANAWYGISANLVSIPNAIAGYGIAFNVSMSTINSLVAVLQTDPGNAQAISALKQQFSGLISQLRAFSQSAVSVHQSITDYSNTLIADSQVLAKAVTDSTKQQEVNRDQVAQYRAKIEEMRKQVKTWQVVETASAIGAGVAFFAGAVIAIFSLGFGLAFGIVGAAAGIATMVAAQIKIKTLNSEIQADTARMNAVTQQSASLAALNDQLNTLIELSKAAGSLIGLLLKVWEELEGELNTVLTDLNNCKGNVDTLNLPELQRNLNLANQDWQTLVGLCNSVASIKYNQATPAKANIQ